MIWYVFYEYKKLSNIKSKNIIKNVDAKIWIELISLLVLLIILFVLIIKKKILWLIFFELALALFMGGFLGKEIRKVRERLYGSGIEYYSEGLNELRYILKDMNIYSKAKIDILIKEAVNELPELKLSHKIFKPIISFTTIVLVPVLIVVIKWILNRSDSIIEGIKIIGVVVLITSTIMVIFNMFKSNANDFFDNNYYKMKKTKDMLVDIILVDFTEDWKI